MKRVILTIDTSELKDEKYIVFSTERRILSKERLRKSLNQTFIFNIDDKETICFEFDNEELSFGIELIKLFCYQLAALFPKAYYYDAWFVPFKYKLSIKYELITEDKTTFEFKLHEASANSPIVYVSTKWESESSYLIEHGKVTKIRKTYMRYMLELILTVGITFLFAVLWFLHDLSPETVHVLSRPFIFPIIQGMLAISHACRAMYTSHKQYNALKNSNYNLNCFK